MTTALSRLYCGPLEQLTPPIIGIPADALPAERLLDTHVLDELLERYSVQYQSNDIKAITSIWSKWHFSTLVVPYLAANLLLERDLPVELDEMAVLINDEGCTTSVAIAHEGKPLDSLDAFQRFERLLQGHVSPLVETLSCISGAAPKVFWSNFGNYFEYFVANMAHHPMALPHVADEAKRLLDHRVYPDGRRNPMFMPVRYMEDASGEVQRTRRLCCLRYRIPEFGYCGNCPLDECGKAKASKARPDKTGAGKVEAAAVAVSG